MPRRRPEAGPSHSLHVWWRTHRRCGCRRLARRPLAWWWTHWPHAGHTRPWSPLSAVCFHLSELPFPIPNREVCDASNEEDDVVVGAVESVCAAKGRTRRAVRPFAIVGAVPF